jgi:hypothetical protein
MDKERIYNDVIRFSKAGNTIEAYKSIINLLSVRNELNKVLSFLIDMYFTIDFWCSDFQINMTIKECLEGILQLPKRLFIKNVEFQNLFGKLVTCIFYRKASIRQMQWLESINSYTGARLERKLENVLMCREAYAPCKIVSKLFRDMMTQETAQLFDGLYNLIRKGENTLAILLVKYMIHMKTITFDRVPGSCAFFEDIRDELRASVVWYIWWFLLSYAKKYAREKYDVVETNFHICKLCLHKQSRDRRLTVLFFVIRYLIKGDIVACDLELDHSQVLNLFEHKPIVQKNESKVMEPCPNDYLNSIIYIEE